MPDKRQSKSPRTKRGKKFLPRSTYALRMMAWTVAEWAKQFTTPEGTLAFESPDKRRDLEIRLTVLATVADKHWTDLRDVDRDAVDFLFALTLGPGMREAWQHQRKLTEPVGGAPVLLRCHDLQRIPDAAINLNLALTTLSADGLGGQFARDPEAQSFVWGVLEKVSTVCDEVYRKHRPPEKDMTWQDMACDLLEHIDQARKASQGKSSAKLGDWNALTDRQRDCMRALLKLGAFNADSRWRCQDIAVKAEGRDANVNGFKEPLSDLVLRGLAQSRTGREGGYWLTACGHKLLVAFDADSAAANASS